MIFKQNQFVHGIDQNFNKNFGQVDRLHTLRNARLFKRGEVGYVSRIEGYESLLNDVNISNPIDIIEHKEKLFVLTNPSGNNYSIFVFDIITETLDNEIQYQHNNNGGELNAFEDFVFIETHNRFLYDDEGTWTIHDFVSTVPLIESITPATGGDLASGEIEVGSDYIARDGDHASADIYVSRNLLQRGDEKEITVSFVRGRTETTYSTNPFTITSEDTVEDIAEKIADQINTDLDDDWEATQIEEGGDFNRQVKVRATSFGTDWNGYKIRIEGTTQVTSSRNTRDRSQRGTRSTSTDRTRSIRTEGRNLQNRESTRAESNIVAPDIYIMTDTTGGGTNLDNKPVKLLITIFKTGFRTTTETIVNTDTASDIASKIVDAINESDDYTASVVGTTVTVESVIGSEEFDSTMTLGWVRSTTHTFVNIPLYHDYADIPTITNITGGGGETVIGGLQPFTDYWYKVRFVYNDGHKTNTSFAKHVNTGVRRNVNLTISVADGDDVFPSGDIARVELYRKETDEDFRLIQIIRDPEITNDEFTYLDSGDIDIKTLSETPLLWTKNNKTGSFIQNRYVRANVEYNDFSLADNNFTLSTYSTTDEDNALPSSSDVDVFVKPLYEDGTFGFHKNIGRVNTSDSLSNLRIDQTALYQKDRDIKEFGVYLESRLNKGKSIISFNSTELANENIATQASLPNDDSVPDEFPIRTQVLYGYKYIVRVARENGFADPHMNDNRSDSVATLVYDDSLRAGEDRENFRYFVHSWNDGVSFSTFADRSPEDLDIRIFDQQKKYIKVADVENEIITRLWSTIDAEYITTTDRLTVSVYKMSDSEGIVESAFSGNLFISVGDELSSFVSSQRAVDLEDLEIRVIGAIDQSDEYPTIRVIDEYPYLLPPTNNKIYLQLEESPLDDIDDITVNNVDQRPISVPQSVFINQPADELDSLSNNNYTMSYNLFNIEEIDNSLEFRNDQTQSIEDRKTGFTYNIYDWHETRFRLFSDAFRDLPIIYVGSIKNEVTQNDIEFSPFMINDKGLIEYFKIKENLLFEEKVEETDIIRPKSDYPNQIIWSEPIIRESFESGARNFRFDSFFNLPTNNGEVIKLIEFNGRLFAFCERGVAQLNIGEVVTQQQSGQLAVDTTRFITNYVWLTEGLKNIKENTIVKHEGNVFFSDGYDAYRISREGIDNISKGAVSLDGNNCVGTIDPLNGEYRISDCVEGITWAYSFITQQWFGPYTYSDEISTYFRNDVYSIIENDIVKHNQGNTFGGTTYDTVIESVANDFEDPIAVKLFRKFYIITNTEEAQFSYSSDGEDYWDFQLSNLQLVNGAYRLGVNLRNHPALFWKVETNEEGFQLNSVGFYFRPRRRVR